MSGPSADDGVSYQVTISTDHVALFVLLETDIDGVFSDNGFVMHSPSVTVTFTSRENTSSSTLLGSIEVRSLTDTYDTDTAWKRHWQDKVWRERGYYSVQAKD